MDRVNPGSRESCGNDTVAGFPSREEKTPSLYPVSWERTDDGPDTETHSVEAKKPLPRLCLPGCRAGGRYDVRVETALDGGRVISTPLPLVGPVNRFG